MPPLMLLIIREWEELRAKAREEAARNVSSHANAEVQAEIGVNGPACNLPQLS